MDLLDRDVQAEVLPWCQMRSPPARSFLTFVDRAETAATQALAPDNVLVL